MAGITISDAQAHLDEWLAADLALAKGQAYSIAGRSLTRADAEDMRANIEFWDRQVKRISRGGITPMAFHLIYTANLSKQPRHLYKGGLSNRLRKVMSG